MFAGQKPRVPYFNAGHPLNRGLEGAWLFSEGMGRRVADVRARNPGFMASSAPWEAGRNGSSMGCNGASFNLGMYSNGIYAPKFSIAAWVYPTSFAGYRTIVCRGTATQRSMHMDIEQTSGKLRLYYSTGAGTFKGFTANTGLTLNRWAFVAGTFDGTTLAVFLNTFPDGTSTQNFTVDDIGPLKIGCINAASDFFQGQISEVRLWRRPLLRREIQDVYRSDYSEFKPPDRSYLFARAATPAGGGVRQSAVSML
jgi:hypothetical protein